MSMQALDTGAFTGNLTHKSQNDTRLHDFELRVCGYGRDLADGKDALPKFALDFVRQVCDDVIDLAKDKNGQDAAARYFGKYASAAGTRSIHDRSKESVKAQESKMRALMKACLGPWDFVQVCNDALCAIADYKKDDIDTKPTYAALVDIAREQLKTTQQLTAAEIGVLVLPTTSSKEVTLEGELAKISKKMETLITGEGKDGLKDQSPELMQAQELIATRIKDLMLLAQNAADDKVLAEIAARRGGVYVATEA